MSEKNIFYKTQRSAAFETYKDNPDAKLHEASVTTYLEDKIKTQKQETNLLENL